MFRRPSPHSLDAAFLASLVVATRIPFRSHYLYDVDSVNFALGIRRFDPTVHQPHPPGYFLYVYTARIVNAFMHDVNAALITIAIAASCGAAVLIYALAEAWFGRRAALFAGILFVFSPLAWFHGIVALIYALEAFFSALLGYLCWHLYRGRTTLIVPAAVVAGIASGFRPSFLLFLAPLLLFSILFTRSRMAGTRLSLAAIAFVLTASAWALPMLNQSGGWHAWWLSLRSAWLTVPARHTVLNSSPAISLARLFSIGGILVLCFGAAAAFTFCRRHDVPAHKLRAFVWVWIGPALLFFTLVFLKFVNSGYLLVMTPPLFALLGWKASEWYRASVLSVRTKAVLLCGTAAANTLIFLFAPVYCSWTSVRHFEAQLRSTLNSLSEIASPRDTMIVGFDSHFLGYRHAGYYLADWCTVQFPEVRGASETHVFSMEHGETRLLNRLPVERFRRFVLLPLPAGDSEYAEYIDRVRALFPAGGLAAVHADSHEFLVGNVTGLNVLFPETAK